MTQDEYKEARKKAEENYEKEMGDPNAPWVILVLIIATIVIAYVNTLRG
jgi:hypothetical protein